MHVTCYLPESKAQATGRPWVGERCLEVPVWGYGRRGGGREASQGRLEPVLKHEWRLPGEEARRLLLIILRESWIHGPIVMGTPPHPPCFRDRHDDVLERTLASKSDRPH